MLSTFSNFKRCHKSYIVNTKEIQSYNRSKSTLLLTDDSEISISDERISEVLI
jgi:DNA-binding LytR/AlgR family response regulator